MAVRLPALCAGRPFLLGRFLVLISARGRVDPSAIVRVEGLDQLRNPWSHLNPTRDLPACSIVHEPSTLSCVPILYCTKQCFQVYYCVIICRYVAHLSVSILFCNHLGVRTKTLLFVLSSNLISFNCQNFILHTSQFTVAHTWIHNLHLMYSGNRFITFRVTSTHTWSLLGTV
jgi:hypothetical protein